MPAPWRDLGSISGAILRLTPDEANELSAAADRGDGGLPAGTTPDVEAPPDSARVVVQLQVMPRV